MTKTQQQQKTTNRKRLKTIKEAINQTANDRKYAKAYEQENAACLQALGRSPALAAPPNPQATKLRATLLSACVAHSRGRMHFQKVGLWWAYNAAAVRAGRNVTIVPTGSEGFAWQSRTLRKHLDRIRQEHFRHDNYRFSPIFTLKELDMLDELVDIGNKKVLLDTVKEVSKAWNQKLLRPRAVQY